MIYTLIKKLISYGVNTGLVPEEDIIYTTNRLLCVENEGYAGRVNHPARQNPRIIPVTINDRKWGFQYSPYVYYNEHCIVFNSQHVPMKIEHATFCKLFDFVK